MSPEGTRVSPVKAKYRLLKVKPERQIASAAKAKGRFPLSLRARFKEGIILHPLPVPSVRPAGQNF